MRRRLLTIGLALAALISPIQTVAQQKPLVNIGGVTKQLPAGTTLGSQPSTTTSAGINIPQGVDPTTPNDGDIWVNTQGLTARLGGKTIPALSGVGNTPTLSVGSSLYPTNVGGSGSAKYDATSNILTNVVGAKFGMFGVASKDNTQWPNTYVPGIDATGHATVFAVSPTGYYGLFGASRSSDASNVGANVVGAGGLSVCDNTGAGLNQLCWGQYSAAYVQPSSSFTAAYGHEITLRNNYADSPIGDPFSYNANKATNVLRLTCGDGQATSYLCSAFVVAANNQAKAKSGIVFGDQSLDTSGGTAPVLSMPYNYTLNWYGSAGNPTWRIFSNSGNGANMGQMILGDNTADIYLQNGTYHPLAITTTGIATQQIAADSLSLTTALPIASGGTGSTSASTARTALGLGTAATANTGTSGSAVPLLNASNTWSATQAISRDGTASSADVIVTSDAGQNARFRMRSAGIDRWTAGKSNTAETGSDVGSNYVITRFNDAGTAIDAPITIIRSTGAVTLSTPLALTSGGTGSNSASGARTALGLGTSATVNTGTSGSTLGLLNTANTWSAGQSFTSGLSGTTSSPAFASGTYTSYHNFNLGNSDYVSEFAAEQAGLAATDALTTALKITSGTIHQTNAFASYLTSGRAKPATNGGDVAGYFHAKSIGANTNIFGINPITSDSAGFAGQTLQNEVDVNVFDARTSVQALGIVLNSALSINTPPNAYVCRIANTAQWGTCMYVPDGTTSATAIYLGTSGIGNNFSSQKIQFVSRNSGGTVYTGEAFADATGSMILKAGNGTVGFQDNAGSNLGYLNSTGMNLTGSLTTTSGTFNGNATLTGGAVDRILTINANASQSRYVRYSTAGVARWDLTSDNSSESGSSAGSNFLINRFNDAGTYVGTPLSINRATGAVSLQGDLVVGPILYTGVGVSTGNAAVEVGSNRTGTGASFIDMHAVSGTDYEARFLRNSGTNGSVQFINTGTGGIELRSNGSVGLNVDGNANVTVPGTLNGAKIAPQCPNILAYGGNNTGSVDNASAWSAVFAAQGGTNNCIYFPPGTYLFNSSASTSLASGNVGAAVTIKGDGQTVTTLKFADNVSGIGITLNQGSQSFHVKDLSIVTNGNTGTQYGLRVVQNNASTPNPSQSSITNVGIHGADGYNQTYYWDYGMQFDYVSNVAIHGISIVGSSAGAAYSSQGTCFNWYGSAASIPVQVNITSSQFNYCNEGIRYGAYAQGLQVTTTNFVGNSYGIRIPSGQSGNDELGISNSQFNNGQRNIVVGSACDGVMIAGNMFYSLTNGAIHLENSLADQFSIVGNTFIALGTGQNGIVIGGGAVGGVITANQFRAGTSNFATGIWLQSSSGKVNVQSNSYTGANSTVINEGTNNTVGGGSA